MRVPNVNCKHKDSHGNCRKKPKLFGMLLRYCEEAESIGAAGTCKIAERFPKPKAPPPPPTRIIYEDIFPSKVTSRRKYKRS